MMRIFKKIVKAVLPPVFMQLINYVRHYWDKDGVEKSCTIGGREILLPYDHQLPNILKTYPDYGANLVRLAKLVAKESGVIDVGANVGDSVALIKAEVDCPIVCIEGHPVFFDFLKENIKQFNNVVAFQYLLGEESKQVCGELKLNDGGTAKIVHGDSFSTSFVSLDDFIKQNPSFQSSKLLKIDTDGYDFKVIKGGINYIKNNKPVLFFEYVRNWLADVGDGGLSIFNMLREIGYDTIIYYDNYGRLLLSTSLHNEALMCQLHYYADLDKGSIRFYDVCLFHADDADLALNFIDKEMKYNL